MGRGGVWKQVRCYEGYHFRVTARHSSGIPRSIVCLGQKIEHSDGHEEQWEKRQIETDLVGKWVPTVLKALGFS